MAVFKGCNNVVGKFGDWYLHPDRIFTGDSIYNMRVRCHYFRVINHLQDLIEQDFTYTRGDIIPIDENICGLLVSDFNDENCTPRSPNPSSLL